jgi:integrase
VFIAVVRVPDRICEMARLADVTPHTPRHTFASLAGDLGFSELCQSASKPDPTLIWTGTTALARAQLVGVAQPGRARWRAVLL